MISICCRWFLVILMVMSATLLAPVTGFTQSRFHISLMTGYEITEGYTGGYDVTLIYDNTWGFRYSLLPDVIFTEGDETRQKSDSISLYSVEGTLKIPMVIRTIDFKDLGGNSSTALDFITAYVGIGYSELNATLEENTYSASNSNLNSVQSRFNVDVPLTVLSMGLYLGEKFVVVDGRLSYLKGEIDAENEAGKDFEFDHWLILISVGIYF